MLFNILAGTLLWSQTRYDDRESSFGAGGWFNFLTGQPKGTVDMNGESIENADDIEANSITAADSVVTINPPGGLVIENVELTSTDSDETAFTLNYTVNKAAGSNNDFGFVIDKTDIASPGGSHIFRYTLDTVLKSYVIDTGEIVGSKLTSNGDVSVNSNLSLLSGGSIVTTSNGSINYDPSGTGNNVFKKFTAIASSGTATCAISGDDDLCVNGKIEIEDDLIVGDNISMASGGHLITGDDVAIYLSASAGAGGTHFDTDSSGRGQLLFRLGSETGRQLIVTGTVEDIPNFRDYDHADNGFYTVYWQGPIDPDTDPNQWASIYHDGTSGETTGADMRIKTGAGNIRLEPKTGDVIFPVYTQHIDIQMGSAVVGPTAPTLTTGPGGLTRCLLFDADAEAAHFIVELGGDYLDAATSDIMLNIEWYTESGDVIADKEQVVFQLEYRSIDYENQEPVDNGNITTATATYTQSGAGTDKQSDDTMLTMDADDADNPINPNELLQMKFTRNVTAEAGNSYSGGAVVCNVSFHFPANKLKQH